MPELPEVECVRRMLEPLLVGEWVDSVEVRRRDAVATPDDPPGGWGRSKADVSGARAVPPAELLAGQQIDRIERHGKALAIIAAGGGCVVVHLGMSGWVGPVADPPAVHTHVIWQLRGKPSVGFVDPRRFGGLWCLPDEVALRARWAELGPDAMTIGAKQHRAAASDRRTPIKAALLNQRILAGVGNIYADEALFRAGIHPLTPCAAIPAVAWGVLARAVRTELDRGIRFGGASVSTYRRPDGSEGQRQRTLRVYGRAGLECLVCSADLVSERIAQRTTVWCPECQPYAGTA